MTPMLITTMHGWECDMYSFAIEGINGAGKTPTSHLLVEELEAAGLSVGTYAPYHLVRSKIDLPDIFPMWNADPKAVVDLLHQTIDEIEHDAEARGHDVLMFDRHWMTAFAQKDVRPEIPDLWGGKVVPVVLMTAPDAHTQRLAERGYQASWLQADELRRVAGVYEALYDEYAFRMLGKFVVESATQDLRPIARDIAAMVARELGIVR